MNFCKICKSKNIIELMNYDSTRFARQPFIYNFKTILKFCRNCNFSFHDKLNIKKLNNFYKNNFFYDNEIYKRYSLDKRIDLYKKYFNLKGIKALEIGGGHNYGLEKIFKTQGSSLHSFDLNPQYKKTDKIKNDYNLIVSHMCLEHIPDLESHFKMISIALKNDGFYLTEVPDVKKYNNSLLLFNSMHINHFSDYNIKLLAQKNNLKFFKKIKKKYSHYFGVTYIFKKVKENFLFKKIEKPKNIKKYFLSSIDLLKKDKLRINKIVNNKKNNYALWGSSEMLSIYFKKLPKNVILVDISNQKHGSYKSFHVFPPKILKEKNIHGIIVMTESPVAFKSIKSYVKLNMSNLYNKINFYQIGKK